MNNAVGQNTIKDIGLGKECALHALIFFFDKDSRQSLAADGNFLIYPSEEMIQALRRDYEQMSTMIFGETPTFDDILESIKYASKLLQHH